MRLFIKSLRDGSKYEGIINPFPFCFLGGKKWVTELRTLSDAPAQKLSLTKHFLGEANEATVDSFHLLYLTLIAAWAKLSKDFFKCNATAIEPTTKTKQILQYSRIGQI